MKPGFLDKLITRLDKLDQGSLQTQFLRLAQEKGLMETIFHAIQEGVLLVDQRGLIQYANRAAESLLGIPTGQAERTSVRKVLRDLDWESLLELDEETWHRLSRKEIEVTYPQHRFLAFYAVPLSSVTDESEVGHGDAEGLVVILRDVTREREQTESTIESERLHAITLLAASVAHEIGNPLNSLTIHLQLLEREVEGLTHKEDRENLGELVDVAREEITRLDEILRQFLGALRPVQPSPEGQLLEPLVRDTLKVLQSELDHRGIWVEVENPKDPPAALVDKLQIQQAFFNLIKNAMQAMTDGGLIKISLSHNDTFVIVRFQDQGGGIDQDQLSKIFEPYTTTKPGGSGIGLLIVQRILRDHGGLMDIDTVPGEGSTFTVYLPREDRRMRMLEVPTGAAS